jgi:hypothetical protein
MHARTLGWLPLDTAKIFKCPRGATLGCAMFNGHIFARQEDTGSQSGGEGAADVWLQLVRGETVPHAALVSGVDIAQSLLRRICE